MAIIRPAHRQVEDIETGSRDTKNRQEWISEPGGLTQMGAFIQTLAPGTRSSIKHWHESEDEFVYVLEGQVTVVEGEAEHLLGPGDAATFPKGNPVGHFLWNRSASLARCMVVGTRARTDRITYPDHDRVMHRDRSLTDDTWTDTSGNPADDPYTNWLP
jgi:uncharacterized cupin superfamily protein